MGISIGGILPLPARSYARAVWATLIAFPYPVSASAITGSEIVGAIGFIYGDPSAADSGFPVLPFLAIALPILAIGAWFTWRRIQVAATTDATTDDEPTDEADDSVPQTTA